MANFVTTELKQIRTIGLAKISKLETDLEMETTEYEGLLAQLAFLKEQIMEKEQFLSLMKQELVEEKNNLKKDEREVVYNALSVSRNNLIAFAAKVYARKTVQDKLQQLLGLEPGLEKKFEDFQQFEENRAGVLQNLPSSHRQLLLQHQGTLGEELQPYFNLLEHDRQILAGSEPLDFQIVLVQTEDKTDYTCVLPIALFLNDIEAEVKTLLEILSEQIIRAVSNLVSHEEPKVNTSAWGLLSAIEFTNSSSDSREVAQLLEQVLLGCFAAMPILEGFNFTCTIFEVETEDFLSEASEPETNTSPETTPTFTESLVTNGTEIELVHQDDISEEIVTASTPAPTYVTTLAEIQPDIAELSGNVTEQIRTLLIHLIGYGYVGSNGVSTEELSERLANKSVVRTIEPLISNAVIMEQVNSSISLNPERLLDVEDLINRNITPFWLTISQKLFGHTTEPQKGFIS